MNDHKTGTEFIVFGDLNNSPFLDFLAQQNGKFEIMYLFETSLNGNQSREDMFINKEDWNEFIF